MHLTGKGFYHSSGVKRYSDEKSEYSYPDREKCLSLAKEVGIPEDCVEKIGILENAKVDDVFLWFDKVTSYLTSIGLQAKDFRENAFCKMAVVSIDGSDITFGFQFHDEKFFGLVSGRCEHKWVPVPRIDYGNTVVTHTLSPYTEETCIYDLQCGNDYCYYASEGKTMNGNRIIILRGNGWQEEDGFPYDVDKGYPGIIGKTAQNLRLALSNSRIPDFQEVYSGDIRDLVEMKHAEDLG